MRLREETALPDDVTRELEALDAALAGRPVADDLADLGELAVALRDERPHSTDVFARELDSKAAAGFRPAASASGWRQRIAVPSRRMWVPALGAAASVAVATVLALSLTGSDDINFGDRASSGDVAATTESSPGPAAAQVVPGSGGEEDTATTPEAAREVAPLPRDAAGLTSPGASDGGAAGAPPVAKARPNSATGEEPERLGQPLPAPITPSSSDTANRSVERGANLRLATTPRRLDDVAGRIVRVTDGVGGFVRSSAVDSRSGLGGGATFELQIPVSRLQTAIARLSQLASVRSRNESSLDVTEQVTFARNRVVALRAERRSLLRQLESATSLEQTARLRARLRSVESRLDSAKSARAQLRQRTAYSAVLVQVVTERPREGAAAGPWTPRDALGDAARVLEVAAGVALVALAVLLPVALLALIAWPLARSVQRRRRDGALGAQSAGAAG